jgi:heterotetrameric sarcosine oxidase gamma subunit
VSELFKSSWQPRSAWSGILAAGCSGRPTGRPGIMVSAIEGLGMATVIGRRDRAEELERRLSSRYSISLSRSPRVAAGRGCNFVWAGPDQWLAVSMDRMIATELQAALAGVAAVSDQSDARAVVRVGGPRVREVLAKGCSLDLHSRVFRTGDVAVTAISHIGVHLWQVDDAPTYEFAVFRGFARSFWSWLAASAAEFGIEVTTSSCARIAR